MYFLGLLFIIGASIWYQFLESDRPADRYLVMAAAGLAGIGGSTLLVISLSLTADLIDRNTVSTVTPLLLIGSESTVKPEILVLPI